jgi:gas vesicle protein
MESRKGAIDMKKSIIAGIAALSLTFGGVAGASVTTLLYTKEGLKDKYTEEFNKFIEDLSIELREYEEEKVGQLEKESRQYFEAKKQQYRQAKIKQIDEDYQKAHDEVFSHIDKLFNQGRGE